MQYRINLWNLLLQDITNRKIPRLYEESSETSQDKIAKGISKPSGRILSWYDSTYLQWSTLITAASPMAMLQSLLPFPACPLCWRQQGGQCKVIYSGLVNRDWSRRKNCFDSLCPSEPGNRPCWIRTRVHLVPVPSEEGARNSAIGKSGISCLQEKFLSDPDQLEADLCLNQEGFPQLLRMCTVYLRQESQQMSSMFPFVYIALARPWGGKAPACVAKGSYGHRCPGEKSPHLSRERNAQTLP